VKTCLINFKIFGSTSNINSTKTATAKTCFLIQWRSKEVLGQAWTRARVETLMLPSDSQNLIVIIINLINLSCQCQS
jgi:hypothetical protein